jgi:NADPH-dependent 2,4-dienoyl-CoA reductase/sulfur reductase-like enzyme/nitrite reductase/ring-hydroxylating ferredoxin subunit
MADAPETGPDFAAAYPWREIPDQGSVKGRVGDEPALLVRRGDAVVAVGASCTHYHGPLAEGLIVGDTIRCPWHHACFDLRTGAVVGAPALDPIPCWRVERDGARVFARERLPPPARGPAQAEPSSIVIVGGGAAGVAAAERLRRLGYTGVVAIVSADASPPSDRPNLSKDFLAGTADEDWIPLRSPEFYHDQRIELLLDSTVVSLDVARREVTLGDGQTRTYGALLIATGADPVHLDIPGAAPGQVLTLRTFDDSRSIVARATGAKRAVVIGASFIGLEVAASLRARQVEVHVVAPESRPLERVLGPEVGDYLPTLHEQHEVTFHLGATVSRIDGRALTLSDGTNLEADLVIAGVGVRPAVALAERAGLAVDHGIVVDEYLQTSAPGVYAAGDVARYPDPRTGARIRVEHWVVAERQGQTAAANMLGRLERFAAVPFFWSQHYDVTINYVGHAERWDAVEIDGSLADADCEIRYRRQGRTLAVATIGRDRASLQAERTFETESPAAR